MSKTRDTLDEAKRGYGRLRYPGDLAGDVFARLDAADRDAFRIDRSAAHRTSAWRPVLAIAATLAVLASTVAVLVHTRPGEPIAMKDPTPPVVVVRPVVKAPATGEEANVEFTIVPSYQSFAFSVPTSLTPASLEEYDRQSQTTTDEKQTTGGDDAATTTVQ